MWSEIAVCLDDISPLITKLWIALFLKWELATWWKYWAFLSPPFSHKDRDFWCQLISSSKIFLSNSDPPFLKCSSSVNGLIFTIVSKACKEWSKLLFCNWTLPNSSFLYSLLIFLAIYLRPFLLKIRDLKKRSLRNSQMQELSLLVPILMDWASVDQSCRR